MRRMNSRPQSFLYWSTIACLLLANVPSCIKTQQCSVKRFENVSVGPPLPPSITISNHTINIMVECYFHCLKQEKCFGYNYRLEESNGNTVNCQLSNSTEKWNRTETGEWVHYQDVRVIEDINECSRGSHKCDPNATCTDTEGSYQCQCNSGFTGDGHNCTVPKSCSKLFKEQEERQDGVYTIDPDGLGSFQVWCDMVTDGGGWTVFQRRVDGSVDFYRGWQEYKTGFGNLKGNFWLGLDKINRLTSFSRNVSLRVDLMDFDNTTAYAKYESFSVADESNSYTLSVGRCSGNAKDSLTYQNGMKFTTNDRDNDMWTSGNCAVQSKGAWWYNNCRYSNLNGQYLKEGQLTWEGIAWYYWKNDKRSMKEAEMKARPAQS